MTRNKIMKSKTQKPKGVMEKKEEINNGKERRNK